MLQPFYGRALSFRNGVSVDFECGLKAGVPKLSLGGLDGFPQLGQKRSVCVPEGVPTDTGNPCGIAGRLSSTPARPYGRGSLLEMICMVTLYQVSPIILNDISILSGVRLAVSTLCAGQPGMYPGIDWDVAILSLRDSNGRATPPNWQVFPLEKHLKCTACANQ